ncbi:helix-turn-helix domain-containing protein [Cellulosimicrobium arenosum]|uniref:Helix-turn-helix transcriptional regulator n=1 Tax=Cellulosimicrobium arenosum TaxID=2708133 RepID=A0A927PFN0_9MICO|nr:helix-turn-helix transcriptional regulator [Cellulosimicrobium arenosum]MBD8080072.1 helix-turn-helix transcriptional regulator [Cellulosimicrobium arenosum]
MAENIAPPAPRPDGLRPAPDRDRAAARRERGPLWRHVLGDQLRALRHARAETLSETAGRAGVSPQYLSEMERGTKEPSSEMIAAVAGALDVTLVDLTLGVAQSLQPSHVDGARAATCRSAYALAA